MGVFRQPTPPTAVSLFTGAGGLDIGFQRAGYDIRLAIELDSNCVKTLCLNGFKNVWQADISNERLVTPRRILKECDLRVGELDVVFGGPPCQAFSMTGRRKGLRAADGQLVRHFCRLVRGLRPQVFVFENVPGIFNSPMRGVLKLIELELGRGGVMGLRGYDMSRGLLNAAAFGVPQMRERAFIVGWQAPGTFYFPHGTHFLPGMPKGDGLRRFATVADAFHGLPSPEKPSHLAKRVAATIAERNRRWHGK
jgi:DNA (cytosine-5)-methyltransferase 1